jgi:serine/threonine protein kinase/Tol biopolymer transport system component
MKLSQGSRIGSYEILSILGAGGMGEVYCARDTKLGREVAIKVLPSEFSSDRARLSRFEKEARSASALNHPNIITIHEIGQVDSTSYIVMELVDGKTLREILSSGPMTVHRVLEIASQIAEGLAKAHSAQIIHRDLKPENVMITKDGFVKILDFGLAKLHQDDSQKEGSHLTTLSSTHPGLIVGTIGYMSPEQAGGDPIDFRSDQFSFGAVLYEMLTGKRAFQRNTVVNTISAILKDEPQPIDTIIPNTPGPVRWVIDRCLSKDPDGRYSSTKDLAHEIHGLRKHFSEISTMTSGSGPAHLAVPSSKSSARVAWIIAAIAVLFAIIAGMAYLKRVPVSQPTIRFHVSPPQGATFNFVGRDAGPVIVAPDGRRMAFVATSKEGKKQIYVRKLNSLDADALEGTEGATYPFWSGDSRFIGFFAEGKLKKIGIHGGPAQTLCDALAGRGGAWNRDGVIVFTPGIYEPLYRISANGSSLTQLTRLEKNTDELSHRWPYFLPDQRHIIYIGFKQNVADQKSGHRVHITSIDGKENTIVELNTQSQVLAALPGYLLFGRENSLLAQAFDMNKLQITGEAFPIAQQVQLYLNTGNAIFSVSQNGVLAYQQSSTPSISQLKWFDRNGKEISTLGPPGDYEDPDLSPDGKKVAINSINSQIGSTNIWYFDVLQNKQTRFTFSASFDHHAVWTPDQTKIVYDSQRRGRANLYVKSLSGTGSEELLLESDEEKTPTCYSSDGRYLVYQSSNLKTKSDLWLLQFFGDRKPIPLIRTENNEVGGQISPDNKWLAYTSDESGKWEIYVTSFPKVSGKRQISTSGGTQPRWRADGKELFYLSTDRKLMSVEIKEGERFEEGEPKPLFATQSRYTGNVAYDISADGKLFLINTIISNVQSPPLAVVLNWNNP